METLSVFDRLVEELSREERRKLLTQIENGVTVSEEPLRREGEEDAAPDTEITYRSLNPLAKFFYRLQGLFSAKSGLECYETRLLAKLKKTLAGRLSGLADFHQKLFLEDMKAALQALAESAAYLKRLILPPLNKNRGEFIALLARCQCEPLMKRLEDETDPRSVIAEKKISTEADIKTEMDRRFLAILGELPEEDRKVLYLDCQSLEYLRQFCEFDFAPIIDRFARGRSGTGHACSFSEISKRLLFLAEILKSARLPPSKNALKALFLYALGGEAAKEPEWADFLPREYAAAELALLRIRNFNRTIPLTGLAKILTNNFNYQSTGLRGGEDWFVLFKKYWAARLSEIFKNYVFALRTTVVTDKALALLGLRQFEGIKNYHPSFYDTALTPAHWRSLSLILGFYKNIFLPRFLKSLKLLFLHGEFYKTENRVEFADTFNFLNTLNEKLLFFEKRLEPGGEIGQPMADAKKEKITVAALRKKLEALLKRADEDALALVEKTIAALKTVNDILNGVLFSEAGGKYDTISNLGYLGGKENEHLKKDWERIIVQSHEIAAVLQELCTVETPG